MYKRQIKNGICSYQIEAAISGLHSQAQSFHSTDWEQISLLYNKLLSYKNSPIVELNKAVADIMLKQYTVVEATLNRITEKLRQYPPLYLAKAELYLNTNRIPLAVSAYQQALVLSDNSIEKVYIRTKLAQLN